MKRRVFNSTAAVALAASAPALRIAQAQGQSPTPVAAPKAGTDYKVLERKIAPTAAGKIDVLEFFGYWCPHCNILEPQLSAWTQRLPKDVLFTRIPVFFGGQTEPYQKLYYTLEAMNLVGQFHAKVFQALHVEKATLNSPSAILAWADKQGIDKTKFSETYNSFAVQNKAKRAEQLTSTCEIDGIPAMVVGGAYLVSNSAKILSVTDALIATVRGSKKA